MEHVSTSAALVPNSMQHSTTPSRAQAVHQILEPEDETANLERAGQFSVRRSIALIGGVSLLLWAVVLVSVRLI